MTIAISIADLKKTYGNGFEALKGISLEVEEGDFFALLGPNGAGKSTTIGVLSTLVKRTSGKVQVFGKNVDTHIYETKYDLGLVPQEFNFNQFEKVQDVVITQAGYYGLPKKLAIKRSEKYLRKLGLWEKRDEQSRSLSGGMKRRLMIARALAHEPRLLILDEPTAGVDIELRRSMWKFLGDINASGTTIVLTTHYLEEAEQLCRNIAIIDDGLIIENTSMRNLLTQLDSETFILDSFTNIGNLPNVQIDGVSIRKLDDKSLEVTLSAENNINQVFIELDRMGVKVSSLRNKTNRLEQLFLSRLERNGSK
ncbi:MAG: ABC transporter ATP-binding protein [Gammaproteobacteria bacterium]|nr:ABC transporter ATP-binding protein [Gammaproteobacteria bacterium]